MVYRRIWRNHRLGVWKILGTVGAANLRKTTYTRGPDNKIVKHLSCTHRCVTLSHKIIITFYKNTLCHKLIKLLCADSLFRSIKFNIQIKTVTRLVLLRLSNCTIIVSNAGCTKLLRKIVLCKCYVTPHSIRFLVETREHSLYFERQIICGQLKPIRVTQFSQKRTESCKYYNMKTNTTKQKFWMPKKTTNTVHNC